MFQFSYKLKVSERVKAKCDRHRYNPERDGRGSIKGGCSTCFALYDLHQARLLTRVPLSTNWEVTLKNAEVVADHIIRDSAQTPSENFDNQRNDSFGEASIEQQEKMREGLQKLAQAQQAEKYASV